MKMQSRVLSNILDMYFMWQPYFIVQEYNIPIEYTATEKALDKKWKKLLHNRKSRCIIMQNKILNIHKDVNFIKDNIERKDE